MKVIGIQRNASFTYNGKQFTGINIYTSEIKNGVDGVISKKYYIDNSKDCYKVAESLKLGDNVRIYSNDFGKPEYIVKD